MSKTVKKMELPFVCTKQSDFFKQFLCLLYPCDQKVFALGEFPMKNMSKFWNTHVLFRGDVLGIFGIAHLSLEQIHKNKILKLGSFS